MRAGARVLLVSGAVALAGVASIGCGPAWHSPDPPGEWGDAAAAGTGYGPGLPRKAHIFFGDKPEPGPSPHDDVRTAALKKRAAENPDAGASADAGADR
jgi:hypothetical protein